MKNSHPQRSNPRDISPTTSSSSALIELELDDGIGVEVSGSGFRITITRSNRERLTCSIKVEPSSSPDDVQRPVRRIRPTNARGQVVPLLAGSSEVGERHLFRKEGEYWTIGEGSAAIRLKHSSGLGYIAHLLRQPRTECCVLDLFPRSSVDRGDAGELLDGRARAEYKRRLAELRDELAEATAGNDIGRAELAEKEIEQLTSELERAFGLGGRPRKAGSHAERARINVKRAVARAIEKIRGERPELARYLEETIRTGIFCSYRPPPAVPIEFRV